MSDKESDVKQKIAALSEKSTPLQTKIADVENLISLCVKNLDFASVVKENDGVIVLSTLAKNSDDYGLKTKVTTLLLYLSLSGHNDATTENVMKDVNVLSLVNLFSEKDFHVLMQAFGGIKLFGNSSSSSKDESVSLGLSAATIFLENITNLITPSSKLLSDFQKIEILSNFTQFVLAGALAKATDDSAKSSNATLSKNFILAYDKFSKTLENCHNGSFTPLDMSVVPIIQLVKEGKLIAGLQKQNQNQFDNPFLDTINSWLGGSKKFILLYRATKDGFAASAFHGKCDNKGATVSIITSSEGYVFGGYAAQPWLQSSSWVRDASNKSFIFSLKNPRDGQPTKFDLNPSKNTNAIYSHSSYGPTFGGGHDINCADDSNSNNTSYFNFPYSYDVNTSGLDAKTFTGNANFTTKEIEVFQVQ